MAKSQYMIQRQENLEGCIRNHFEDLNDFFNRGFPQLPAYKESKAGEVFFDLLCYSSDGFKIALKRSEAKEYSSCEKLSLVCL